MTKTDSRTSKSIKNSSVALVFYFINLILQFFSRKIFLDYLGAEVLGLNTTAQNLLGFLNIAELGIGTAISYNLYKPIFENDRDTINNIISIQGWLYRKIASVVIIGSCALMLFFPVIFSKAQVPIWYTYGSFVALLTSSLLGYFVNFKQILLSAAQKEYKITCCVKGGMALKVIMQILAIRFFSEGYEIWMLIEILSAFAISWVLDRTVRKEYPWLCPIVSDGQMLSKRYPQIIIKTKQLFFHKIAGFVLSQTSSLIIYGYASLTLVASYGNYMLIILGVSSLMNALLNGINAGIGNLVAEGNFLKIKMTFWKITFVRMWIASAICFTIYMAGDLFISLWVGEQFVLPRGAFVILIINAFITMTRTNDAFLAAYGLYQDIWAPIAEAMLNLGLSVLLGYYWGLEGILTGVLISLLIIIYGWKPYFLYKNGFKDRLSEYVWKYIKYISVILVSFFVCVRLLNMCVYDMDNTYYRCLFCCVVSFSIYVLVSIFLFCCIDAYPRLFMIWIYDTFQRKIVK